MRRLVHTIIGDAADDFFIRPITQLYDGCLDFLVPVSFDTVRIFSLRTYYEMLLDSTFGLFGRR